MHIFITGRFLTPLFLIIQAYFLAYLLQAREGKQILSQGSSVFVQLIVATWNTELRKNLNLCPGIQVGVDYDWLRLV